MTLLEILFRIKLGFPVTTFKLLTPSVWGQSLRICFTQREFIAKFVPQRRPF